MSTIEFVPRPPESSVKELFRVIYRHKRKVTRFFLAVVLLVTLGTFLAPLRYQSEAKLLVRLGRESVTLDPTASTGQVVSVSQSRQSEINSELEILSSPVLAETVVDSIGDEAIPGPDLLEKVGLRDRSSARGRAISRFIDNLQVEVLKDSNVMLVTLRGSSPELAQKELDKLLDVYMDKHIAAHRTTGSHAFFEKETEQLRQSLTENEARIRDFKNKSNIVSVDEQKRILSNRYGTIQQELDAANSGLSASQAKVGALRSMLADLPHTIVTQQTEVPNTALDSMRGRLFELQLKERDILSKYTEQSEPAKEIHQQVAQVEALLKKEEEARTHTTTGLSAAHMQVKQDLLAEQAIMSALRAKSQALVHEMTGVNEELKRLNDVEAEIAQPERQLDIQRDTYRKYADNLEQARIDQALEKDRISNISVVQSATLEKSPVSPRRGLNMVVGLVLAVFGSVGLAFLSEYMDHTIKRPIEIEDRLQVPALLDIPHMESGHAVPALTEGQKAPPLLPAKGESAFKENGSNLLVPVKVNAYFEILRDHLATSANGAPDKSSVLAVTSCRKGEGVSTVAASLAATVRRESQGRVLLLDARGLRKSESNGHIMAPGYEIHAGGDYVAHEHRMYESSTMQELLALLKRDFTFVVIDTPAIFETAAAVRVCSLADDVLLVVEAEKTPWEVAQEAKRVLERANANLVGVILNKRKFHVPEWLYQRL